MRTVVCMNCGRKNTLGIGTTNKNATCKKCGQLLYSQDRTRTAAPRKKSKIVYYICIFIIVVIVITWAYNLLSPILRDLGFI